MLPFAPDSAYGRPDELKALIDAAHERGLMVFLDVVYNHFGPEGNYLHRIAPQFFSGEQTPWGVAIDYTRPEVRAFAIENAIYWLRITGLTGYASTQFTRLPRPARRICCTISVSKPANWRSKPDGTSILCLRMTIIARRCWIRRSMCPTENIVRNGTTTIITHGMSCLRTSSRVTTRITTIPASGSRAVSAEGFVYQGEPSFHRGGQKRGEVSRQLAPLAFVNFLQNHDQIGNRAKGERLSALVTPAALEAALTILLLSPSPPLIFMGDEWGATEPFPFFCDFEGDLADAVRNGRKAEFSEAYATSGDDIPDPLAASTRDLATLDWTALTQSPHDKRLSLTRALLSVRKQQIMPLLPHIRQGGDARFDDGTLLVTWKAGERELILLANVSDQIRPCPAELPALGHVIWGDRPAARLAPWSVLFALGAR